MEKTKLNIALFLAWAWVMIFELLWSRIIWPYFWTSFIVWTNIIWIILGSLSLGYYIWWKIADKNSNIWILSSFFLIITWLLLAIYAFKDQFLSSLQNVFSSIILNWLIASIVLFAPISVFFGLVSPYIAKLKINSLKNSWKEIWNIYAISTLWSIFWTFFAWFFLIPFFWTNNIILFISLIFIIVSIFLEFKTYKKSKIILIILIVLLFIFQKYYSIYLNKNNIFVYDTMYNRATVYDKVDYKWKKVKLLLINNEFSSAKYINDNSNLVFEYTKYYDLISYFNPNFQNALMIWWAWYVYPSYFLEKFSWKKIDVVEIDPWFTSIAKKHFDLKESSNLKLVYEDWRTYLNKNTKKYDVIFWDAFKSYFSLPFNLTTLESYQKMYDSLGDDWTIIINLISAFSWSKWEFFRAEYKTIKQIFPNILVFKTSDEKENLVQNIVVIASKAKFDLTKKTNDEKIKNLLTKVYKKDIVEDMPLLTDDYAPVDNYTLKAIK